MSQDNGGRINNVRILIFQHLITAQTYPNSGTTF